MRKRNSIVFFLVLLLCYACGDKRVNSLNSIFVDTWVCDSDYLFCNVTDSIVFKADGIGTYHSETNQGSVTANFNWSTAGSHISCDFWGLNGIPASQSIMEPLSNTFSGTYSINDTQIIITGVLNPGGPMGGEEIITVLIRLE